MGKKVKKESTSPCKETFEALPVVGKTPATVVLLLSSPEDDILIKACEAIHTFADKGDENKVCLLGLGALEPLCQLITHSNKLVRRNAFMALGIMATNGDVKCALNKIDVIPLIIDKLSLEDDTVIQEFGTLCLASLSVDFVCKVKIFDNNGLPTLVKLLSSPDPDVKKNSVEIIFNLVQDYQSRGAFHDLGGIPPLLDLLNSDFPVIQHLTLKTLQILTTDKDTRNAFREEHGFEKLIDILNNMEFSDLHAEALQVVANCLCDSETVQLIHKGSGLIRLMDFVLTSNMPEIQSSAVKCITRVAQDRKLDGNTIQQTSTNLSTIADNRNLLHEQNLEKVLVELLSVADVGVKTSSCQGVAAMCVHVSSKDCFRDLGGIPAVVQGLSSENYALKEAASLALSNLTHNNKDNALAVYEAGGHEILVQQLYESCSRTVANAAATLGNMARLEIIRSSLLSHGAMQALLGPLNFTDTQVLINATQCLALLACDAEARAELRRAGGLQPLVNLLQSYQKEVLNNACFAVNVCASDKPTAVDMCKFGAVEILQEVNQSVNRRSNYSKLAMTALLNSNLSIKYSLVGYLGSTDIISDGFYDAGKACAGQRILSLEELSKQPLNQHRPVIVINTEITEKKKEDDKQKNESKLESPTDKLQKMMDDIALQALIKEAKEFILPLHEREQYVALARLVSEAMGGAVKIDKLHEFQWVLHLSELKFQLQSNVIPLGLIHKGIYCHRALLFKCLADSIGLTCTLVRGEYNRAWNEVLLLNGNASKTGCSLQPYRYIVDLMHQPGNLLEANTTTAVQYQTI